MGNKETVVKSLLDYHYDQSTCQLKFPESIDFERSWMEMLKIYGGNDWYLSVLQDFFQRLEQKLNNEDCGKILSEESSYEEVKGRGVKITRKYIKGFYPSKGELIPPENTWSGGWETKVIESAELTDKERGNGDLVLIVEELIYQAAS